MMGRCPRGERGHLHLAHIQGEARAVSTRCLRRFDQPSLLKSIAQACAVCSPRFADFELYGDFATVWSESRINRHESETSSCFSPPLQRDSFPLLRAAANG